MSDNEEFIIVDTEDEEYDGEDLLDQPDFNIFASKDIEEKFKGFLQSELEAAYAERKPMFDKLRRWRKMADNQDMSGREPAWPGASSVNVPVIPILNKTASSRLRTTFNARKPFWSIRSLNEEAENPWIKKAAVLQKYFNIISASRADLNLYDVNNKIMTDLPIAGTVYFKVPWSDLKRNVTMPGFNEDNEPIGDQEREQVIHSGPEVVPFRTEDVLFREAFQDFQRAPWVGYRHRMDWYETSLKGANNAWVGMDKLQNSGRTGQLDFEDTDTQNRNTEQNFDREETSMVWDIDEVWVYYDVNDDGIMEDIVCHYHSKTNTLLNADYNRLGMRPLRPIPFYLRPWSMEGQGLVELSSDMQDEINGLHNMRNDGIHMTEVPQFAVRRGSGIRPKDKISPGKIHFLDDPSKDIKLLQTSKSYIETANLEQLDYSYLERVTGIQDIAGGFSSMLLKSRDTASSQGLRMSAGSEVFMGIIEGVDLAYQDMAEMIFRQLVANKDQVIEKERSAERLSIEDVNILEEILSIEVTQIPYVLSFKARLVEQAETFEGKRQSIMTLVAVYQQFAQGLVPLIQQTYGDIDPAIVKAFMGKFVEGATTLMEKVFMFFGESDIDDFMMSSSKVQTLNEILMAMRGQTELMGGALNGIGTGSGSDGQNQPGGMGSRGNGPGIGQGDVVGVGGSQVPPGI